MAEQAFVKTYLNTLGTQPITYADDYQQPPNLSLKKIPVLAIPVPAPPKPSQAPTASSSATITLQIKSAKPPASFSLNVHPTDPIAAIKHLLEALPNAPPAPAQRLLLRGKALADSKLLQEYPVKNADTLNLVIKPGFHWDPSAPASAPTPTPNPTSTPMPPSTLAAPTPLPASTKPTRGHHRIPSVVLSPSPSSEASPGHTEKDIILTLDTGALPRSLSTESLPLGPYEEAIARPGFWERLLAFLRTELPSDADALTAFEDFLRASKGSLTPSQIARIRDHVGVVGMAGT